MRAVSSNRRFVDVQFRAFLAGLWGDCLAGLALATPYALLYVLLAAFFVGLGGCTVPAPVVEVPPARVIPLPSPQGSAGAPAVVFVQSDDFPDLFIEPRVYDRDTPAIDVVGSVSDICAALAAELGLGLVQAAGAPPAAAGVADGALSVGGAADDLGESIVVNWPGGRWVDLLELLGRHGVAVEQVGAVLVCGAAGTWRFMRPLNMPLAQARLLFDQVSVDVIGGMWFLRGDASALQRARNVVGDLAGAALSLDVDVYRLAAGDDLVLLRAWLATAGLVEYVVVGRRIVAPPYVIGAVVRYLAQRPQGDCLPREWLLRTARPEVVLPFLSAIYPAAGYCRGVSVQAVVAPAAAGEDSASPPAIGAGGGGGGGGVFLDSDRGVVVAWVSARAYSDWLAAMERADPAPRPVVVRWMLLNVGRDDSESVGFAFAEYSGASLESITGGFTFAADLSDLSGSLSLALSRSQTSAVFNLSTPGLIGVEVAAASTRSVAFSAGAVVDDGGTVRQQVDRVDLGIDVAATVRPVYAGWSLDYRFELSAPAPGGSYTRINRSGQLFAPRGQSVVLLAVREQAGSDSRSLGGVSRSDAVGDVYVLVEVLPGVLQ